MSRTPRTRRFPIDPGFPPTWRGRPRNVTPEERRLWLTWLDGEGQSFPEIWYDVEIRGSQARNLASLQGLPDSTIKLLAGWGHLTARRADAIARRRATYRIVEFRIDAKPESLGEIMTYDRLARDQWPELRFRTPILVTTRITDPLARSAELNRIAVHELALAERRRPQPPREPLPTDPEADATF